MDDSCRGIKSVRRDGGATLPDPTVVPVELYARELQEARKRTRTDNSAVGVTIQDLGLDSSDSDEVQSAVYSAVKSAVKSALGISSGSSSESEEEVAITKILTVEDRNRIGFANAIVLEDDDDDDDDEPKAKTEPTPAPTPISEPPPAPVQEVTQTAALPCGSIVPDPPRQQPDSPACSPIDLARFYYSLLVDAKQYSSKSPEDKYLIPTYEEISNSASQCLLVPPMDNAKRSKNQQLTQAANAALNQPDELQIPMLRVVRFWWCALCRAIDRELEALDSCHLANRMSSSVSPMAEQQSARLVASVESLRAFRYCEYRNACGDHIAASNRLQIGIRSLRITTICECRSILRTILCSSSVQLQSCIPVEVNIHEQLKKALCQAMMYARLVFAVPVDKNADAERPRDKYDVADIQIYNLYHLSPFNAIDMPNMEDDDILYSVLQGVCRIVNTVATVTDPKPWHTGLYAQVVRDGGFRLVKYVRNGRTVINLVLPSGRVSEHSTATGSSSADPLNLVREQLSPPTTNAANNCAVVTTPATTPLVSSSSLAILPSTSHENSGDPDRHLHRPFKPSLLSDLQHATVCSNGAKRRSLFQHIMDAIGTSDHTPMQLLATCGIVVEGNTPIHSTRRTPDFQSLTQIRVDLENVLKEMPECTPGFFEKSSIERNSKLFVGTGSARWTHGHPSSFHNPVVRALRLLAHRTAADVLAPLLALDERFRLEQIMDCLYMKPQLQPGDQKPDIERDMICDTIRRTSQTISHSIHDVYGRSMPDMMFYRGFFNLNLYSIRINFYPATQARGQFFVAPSYLKAETSSSRDRIDRLCALLKDPNGTCEGVTQFYDGLYGEEHRKLWRNCDRSDMEAYVMVPPGGMAMYDATLMRGIVIPDDKACILQHLSWRVSCANESHTVDNIDMLLKTQAVPRLWNGAWATVMPSRYGSEEKARAAETWARRAYKQACIVHGQSLKVSIAREKRISPAARETITIVVPHGMETGKKNLRPIESSRMLPLSRLREKDKTISLYAEYEKEERDILEPNRAWLLPQSYEQHVRDHRKTPVTAGTRGTPISDSLTSPVKGPSVDEAM